MSDYNLEHLEESFGKAPPAERLQILRHEMSRPISFMRGYASLLNQIIESNEKHLPEETKHYIQKVIQAGDEMEIILFALTKHSE